MYTILQSSEFDEWLTHLKDSKAKARILSRINSAEKGNLGDCEPVGHGVHEMRVHVGPGYRLYFTQRKRMLIFLLVGGTKSTQRRDIQRSQKMAQAIKE